MAAALTAVVLLFPACAVRRFDPPVASDGWRETVRADWDDLDAAVDVACMRHEIALVSSADVQPAVTPGEPGTRARVFTLVNAGSEPVSIKAAGLGTTDPGDIVLTVRVGHFGDEPRERAIARTLARRLRDLAGVTVAPLRQ